MNYLSVEEVSKSFGTLELFENLSFGISQGQKIALIAKNGTGKTTLLDIIAGKEAPDSGQVVYRKGVKVGFLPQEPDLEPTLSIEETILSSDNEILGIINAYEKALQNPDDAEAYQKAFDQMEAKQAWDFETTYRQILSKLKLDDLSKKVRDLSGGQKKRLALANLLLGKPDLLILDEPTNHLDLEMIEWLEEFLKSENLTLFMVTHDRYFLDRVCNHIIELEDKTLYNYKGNYSYYVEKRAERIEVEQTTTAKAKQLYKKELDWMRRQPKARTTKSKSRIESFGDIKDRASKRRNDHQVELEINMERLGSKVLEMHHVSKGFEDNYLFQNFDYIFKKNERIGIIGKNGTGKSTFLNVLTGGLVPDQGKVVHGETLKIGYYTQGGIQAKEGQKVIEVIRDYGDYIPLTKGRQISASQLLEKFLFDRKKQYDFVEKLSGGEKKRLYLCTVLIQNPNFLILDEPTNDLDIVTLNVLENFLLDFPGCLIVVSHDRYFMDKIVDHLFVFGEGKITDFPGNYSDYRDIKALELEAKYEESSQTSSETSTKSKPTTEPKNKLSFNEQKTYKKLEKEISTLEKEKEKLEAEFLKDLSPEEIKEKTMALQNIQSELEDKTEQWFELSMKLEA
ncbi:ABC-F family ATP-binding cassette domain-containing protein [Psychroflexus sp. YR1-1]|uniref:ABC-F family ATP-binding cassette domain-containing protein n=1 Tax=Psychroflexus aurantiacus TaxID=2709310 RepID=A0A6B3R9Z6_9FLAO|nr:ABC-F family ATP-binding cassette domain-containing protein [Psychroflexus aurantiacus]NEV94401.1 ABC-F family ATP-binding cassette domain-containing protein [Psychroflexus aurantiacus]